MIKILTLKYSCVKCGKPEFITVKNDSLNAKYQLVSKCFSFLQYQFHALLAFSHAPLALPVRLCRQLNPRMTLTFMKRKQQGMKSILFFICFIERQYPQLPMRQKRACNSQMMAYSNGVLVVKMRIVLRGSNRNNRIGVSDQRSTRWEIYWKQNVP